MKFNKLISIMLSATILSGSFGALAQVPTSPSEITALETRLVDFDSQYQSAQQKLAVLTRYASETGYQLYVDFNSLKTYSEVTLFLLGYCYLVNLNNKAGNKAYAYNLAVSTRDQALTREALVKGTIFAIKDIIKSQKNSDRLMQTLAQDMIATRDSKVAALVSERATIPHTAGERLYHLDMAIKETKYQAGFLRDALADKDLLPSRIIQIIEQSANEEISGFSKISANIAANQATYLEEVKTPSLRLNKMARTASRATTLRNGVALGYGAVIGVLLSYDYLNSSSAKWIRSEQAQGNTLQVMFDKTQGEMKSILDDKNKTSAQLEHIKKEKDGLAQAN